MDPEIEREALRRSYRLSRIGFSLLALALVVGSIYSIGWLLLIFTGHRPDLGRLLGIARFEFLVDTFRTGLRITGAFCLYAAWPETTWRRRAGLLLVMSMVDVVLWGTEYAVSLGLATEPIKHEIFRQSLSMAFSWAKLTLYAGLAADVAHHLGVAQAPDLVKAARATATTGATLWFVFFLKRINWQQPWPLAEHPMNEEMVLFYLAIRVIAAICLVQTSLLTLMASRESGRALRDMAKEDKAFNPWLTAR